MMKHSFFSKLLFGVIVWLFLGCSKEMTVPAYIEVDEVSFTTNSAQGSASHNITDVWITADGIDLGVYELPAKLPVLESGKTKIQISPGIKINGLSTKRPVYPLYTVNIQTLELEKEKTYKLTPSFTYHDSVVFLFKEDFEDIGQKFTTVQNSAPLTKTSASDSIFKWQNENNRYSGMVVLSDSVSFFEFATNENFTLRYSDMQYCFLEMNYKTEGDIEVGIYANLSTGITEQHVLTGIYKSSEWKKIYINLTEIINQTNYLSSFTIYINGVSSSKKETKYFFDNFKVVYIQ